MRSTSLLTSAVWWSPRAADRQLLTEALYSLHRGFVEDDAEAEAEAEPS